MAVTRRRAALEPILRELAPRTPPFEFGAALDHAESSVGLRQASLEAAAWLSLVATIRHLCTDYDDLLADGYDIESARFFVRDAINERLGAWGATRRVPVDENEDP